MGNLITWLHKLHKKQQDSAQETRVHILCEIYSACIDTIGMHTGILASFPRHMRMMF